MRFLATAHIVAAFVLAGSPARGQISIAPVADGDVRTDVDARRNDNYGCDPIINIGATRGGGGLPYGSPDGIRPFLRFDLSQFTQPVGQAELQMTLSDFHTDSPPQTFVIDVHRVLEPWTEGDGSETPPQESGCTDVDTASGIAWVGAGDGGDINNETQPPIDTQVWASLTILESESSGTGQVYTWDITALVNAWIGGTYPNYGLSLRDMTSDGTFKDAGFGSREQDFNSYPGLLWPEAAGPRLVLTDVVSVDAQSWGRVKAKYR